MGREHLPTRFDDLPSATQRELIDHAARIAALAYLAQVGAKATTDVALDHARRALALESAHTAIQQSALPAPTKQQVASQFAATLATQRDLRDRLERQILREIGAASASMRRGEAGRADAASSFGDDVMNTLTLGMWGKKR